MTTCLSSEHGPGVFDAVLFQASCFAWENLVFVFVKLDSFSVGSLGYTTKGFFFKEVMCLVSTSLSLPGIS